MPDPRSGPRRIRWRFACRESREGGAVTLALDGRIGFAAASAFESALAAALDAGGSVILDFSGVDYVSSAGLVAMEAAATRAAASGQRLVVCGLADPVERVFDLSGLMERVAVARTRSEAESY
jgi:anti-anti-sigma factor